MSPPVHLIWLLFFNEASFPKSFVEAKDSSQNIIGSFVNEANSQFFKFVVHIIIYFNVFYFPLQEGVRADESLPHVRISYKSLRVKSFLP